MPLGGRTAGYSPIEYVSCSRERMNVGHIHHYLSVYTPPSCYLSVCTCPALQLYLAHVDLLLDDFSVEAAAASVGGEHGQLGVN